MSERHDEFNRLVDFLEEHRRVFNAPYGVLPSNIPGHYAGSIIAYTVTFGCARTMDATVKVFSPTNATLESRGHHAILDGSYVSVDELITKLKLEFLEPF